MRLILILLLIGASLLVQVSALNSFQIFGVKPDLVMLVVVFNAFLRGHREGAFVGFVAGIFQDILTGSYIGLNALSYMTVGYLVGMTEAKLYKDSSVIIMVLTWFASIAGQLVYYLLLLFGGVGISPVVALTRVMFPAATYTALLVPLFYKKFYQSNLSGWLKSREI